VKAPEVRAYPCDPGTAEYQQGPTLANNTHGLGRGGSTAQAITVKWEGIPWRVAHDTNGGILYVLVPLRDVVEGHRPALERLALVVAQYGGVPNVNTELSRSSSGTLTPRIATARPMPKPSDKRLALNAITQAVQDALGCGASMQDIRLAVYSAMGLDSDAA